MYVVSQLKDFFLDYQRKNPFDFAPNELFAPVDYIMQLGGKRLRPILVLMGYNLFKEDIEQALPVAYAIEIFHNFSLVHDDIMDQAPLRRGQATVHHKYDNNTGILSGDVMLIYAYHYLVRIKDEALIPSIIRVFTEIAEKVCIGQQYDMNFETCQTVKISEYLKMIEYKTAVLLAGALKMGAILAKASQSDIYHLGEFGRNIGIAFQLQDDILDTFGNPEKFGKRIGGDIIQNKKTYLVLKTLEVADVIDKMKLNTLMKSSPKEEAKKIATVKAIFQKNQIQKLADLKKDEYQNSALAHLAKVNIPAKRKEKLRQLADSLFKRKE